MPAGIYKTFSLVLLFLLLTLPVVSHAQAALININTADSGGLQTLNGIGPAKAQAIIDYRSANGPFQKIEDIGKVSGIPLGGATYLGIKDFITVGAVPGNGGANGDNEEVAEGTQNNTTTSSSAKSIWFIDNKLSKFEIDISGNRLNAVGTPVEFKAKTNFGSSKSSIFEWNLGDGSIKYGSVISHTYLFPGEYAVILSVAVLGEVIVNRMNVKVIAPELFISIATPERVEVTNNSTSEVDLYGRALVSGGKVFPFPKSTIILPKRKISFASVVSGLSPTSVAEVYLMTVGDNPNKSVNGVVMSEEIRLKDIAKIKICIHLVLMF